MSLSQDILDARRGRITASAAHRMMTGWDTPRPLDSFPTEIYDWIAKHDTKPLVSTIKGFLACEVNGKLIDAAWKAYQFDQPPRGLLTYAEELACDELFETDPAVWTGDGNASIEAGNEREAEAMERLSEATGKDFVKTGDDQIHITRGGVGCTPDGICYDDLDLIDAGAEAKCRTPLHHARQLLITNNRTLLEHDFDRYCQIQVCCHVAGVDQWYSVSFNPYAKRKEHQFHYCVIHRDDVFLKVFEQRAAVVFEHKQVFIEQLNKAADARKAA